MYLFSQIPAKKIHETVNVSIIRKTKHYRYDSSKMYRCWTNSLIIDTISERFASMICCFLYCRYTFSVSVSKILKMLIYRDNLAFWCIDFFKFSDLSINFRANVSGILKTKIFRYIAPLISDTCWFSCTLRYLYLKIFQKYIPHKT